MSKLLFALFAVSLAACNSSSTETKSGDSASKPSTNISTMSAAELNFIDACVEDSKERLGEAKAYTMCKCILPQVKAKYPALDSTVMDELAKDTAAIVQMAKACE